MTQQVRPRLSTPRYTADPTTTAFTYAGYPDPTNISSEFAAGTAPRLVPGVLQCCSTDQGNYLGNDASSKYDALQIKVEKRFSHGLQVLSHYTFAHAYKYDSTYYADDPAVAYGPDDQVRNQVWVNNVVYELPFGKGRMFAGNSGRAEDLMIGGWQITRHDQLGQWPAVDPELRTNAAVRKMWASAVQIRDRDRSTSGAGSLAAPGKSALPSYSSSRRLHLLARTIHRSRQRPSRQYRRASVTAAREYFMRTLRL